MAEPLTGMFEQPASATMSQKIAAALQGFGAGVQGRGPEFVESMNARQQQLDERRQKAMARDAMRVYSQLNDGKTSDALELIQDRAKSIIDLGGDPADTLEIGRLILTGQTNLAQQELGGFLELAMQNGLIEPPKRPEPLTANQIIGTNVVVPNASGGFDAVPVGGMTAEQPKEPDSIRALRMRAQEAGLQPGTPEYAEFMRMGGGGGGVSVTTNVEQPGADKYVEGRASSQAEQAAELERAAESAYRSNQAMDRFIEASASGDAGAAQPVITGVKNLLSSFGINAEGLTDTLMMEQAIGDILSSKMSELGARGLTDRDMQVLRESLPRVATSHEARVSIANVIQKANMATLRDYNDLVTFEQETYPDARFRRPAWLESVREQGFTVPDLMPQQVPPTPQQGRFVIEVVP
jgi:hypothetical protein